MLAIERCREAAEPIPTLPFQIGKHTQSRVTLSPRHFVGRQESHEHQLGAFRGADYGNLSKLQKRDINNASHAGSPR
jgi:hypothetical protein